MQVFTKNICSLIEFLVYDLLSVMYVQTEIEV